MKVALVTGAARRLGREIALALAQQGYAIALHYHTAQQEALDTARAIEELGSECLPLYADFTSDSDVESLFSSALQAFGTIDVLVNNASLFRNDSLETLEPASWLAHQQVNLLAPLRLIQFFARQSASETPRLVINMLDSDLARNAPDAIFLSYKTARSALWQATAMLAKDLAPAIRVNGIAPGAVLRTPTQREEHFRAMTESTPLGFGATSADIISAIRYFIQVPSVTGQILVIDSGESLK